MTTATSSVFQSSIRVHDEHYTELPDDLYIPPAAFAILLTQFEGPLDFLLYLVKKNGLNLRELDIAPIAEQYLTYMQQMKTLDIELTADYLLMAALLTDLKSRLLLPQPPQLSTEADPRRQLLRRLEDYIQIKQAAGQLNALDILERDVFAVQLGLADAIQPAHRHAAAALQQAMLTLLARPALQAHQVTADDIPLEQRVLAIQQQLASGQMLRFDQLLDPQQGRLGQVVTFVALLELIRQQQVVIVHDGQDAPLAVIAAAASAGSHSNA